MPAGGPIFFIELNVILFYYWANFHIMNTAGVNMSKWWWFLSLTVVLLRWMYSQVFTALVLIGHLSEMSGFIAELCMQPESIMTKNLISRLSNMCADSGCK